MDAGKQAAGQIIRKIDGFIDKGRKKWFNIVSDKLRRTFMKYICGVCGYVYDEEAGCPENGIAPGTKFEDLPDDFSCPLCGVPKEEFSAE